MMLVEVLVLVLVVLCLQHNKSAPFSPCMEEMRSGGLSGGVIRKSCEFGVKLSFYPSSWGYKKGGVGS
ncbi:hypothetical protein HanIR_Chr04g0196181 [Helianthus annuus]|nr:hypothetical protein HanIR_Chr04g0196181 [Helianthus annuus]